MEKNSNENKKMKNVLAYDSDPLHPYNPDGYRIIVDNLTDARNADDTKIKKLKDEFILNAGEKYTFRGMIGDIKLTSKNSDIYKFNLYYASLDDETYDTKIIFRCLYCLLHKNDYYVLKDLTHDDKGQIGYNEVIVQGTFSRRSKLTFKIDKISIDRNENNMFRYDNDYDLFNYKRLPELNKCMRDIVSGEAPITMTDLRTGFVGKILRATNKYIEFTEILHDKYHCNPQPMMTKYLRDVIDDIAKDSSILGPVAYKLRLILDDIIMMHTGLQTENHDQLNVLYDIHCLEAMGKILFVIKSLSCVKEYTLTMKQAVMMMLVYIKGFYARYIRSFNVCDTVLKELTKYDNITKSMLDDLCFDIEKANSLYMEIESFVKDLSKTPYEI